VSDNVRDMVEDQHAHAGIRTAKNMPDAANSDASLMGYAAINDADDEVTRLAYRFYQERQEQGMEGSADDDWFRAEQEVRRSRHSLNG
jgi:hypothetical protein